MMYTGNTISSEKYKGNEQNAYMCMEILNTGHVGMCLQTLHADTWRHGLLKYKM